MIRLLLFVSVLGMAETPADVILFLRSTATALANSHDDGNASQFLDHFERTMPGFATLRDEVEALVGRVEVGSVIEVVTESGDDRKRTMDLDWVLEIQDKQPRRQVIKCTIEKQGKNWKFVALEPLEFFKY